MAFPHFRISNFVFRSAGILPAPFSSHFRISNFVLCTARHLRVVVAGLVALGARISCDRLVAAGWEEKRISHPFLENEKGWGSRPKPARHWVGIDEDSYKEVL